MRRLLTLNFDKKRIYGLDILRASAIFFVLLEHSQHTLAHSNSESIQKISKLYSWYIRYLVFDGVTIFFVLSGFLIGSILLKILEDQSPSFKILVNFWLKRWLRTLPAYFATLCILTCLSIIFINEFTIQETGLYFIFLQNFNNPHPDFFPEAWSLSTEEWFYLLIPSFIFFVSITLKTHLKHSFIIAVICVLLFSMLVRYDYFSSKIIHSHEQWDLLLRKQVITRLDSLMYGLIGAYLYLYQKNFWLKHKNILFVTGVIMLLSIKFTDLNSTDDATLYRTVFSFSLTSISTLFLLPFLNNIKSGNGYLFKILTYTSLTSYSMYLLNLSVIQFWIINNFSVFIKNEMLLAITKYFSYWLLVITLSLIMYKYIELPFMNLRKRLTFK